MAAITLRRSLPPKPLSFLFHSSQLSTTTATAKAITSPPFSSFRGAQSTIVNESNPEKIADVLLSQSSFPAFTRYRPIYPYSVRKLARAGRRDLIDRVLEDHLSKNKVSEGFVLRFTMLYSSAGMTDSALTLFYDYGPKFRTSEKLYCAMLTALLNNSEFIKFHEFFNTAVDEIKMLVSPSVKAWNLKLRAYCEEGKVELADELVVEKMESEFKVSPDIHSYNVMLGAYLKGKDWGKFDEKLKEVLRRGLEGNVTTYKYMIVRLCKDKQCSRAFRLLDEMVAKGVKPNVACYNWIIYGFCRLGALDSAKMGLERMISDGHVAPCSLTYYTLFRHMVQEGEFLSALDMCKVILKRKWVPPFEAMEGLVKGLLEMSKKKEACKVVKKMKKRLQGPALVSWGKIEAAIPWQTCSTTTTIVSNPLS